MSELKRRNEALLQAMGSVPAVPPNQSPPATQIEAVKESRQLPPAPAPKHAALGNPRIKP